MKNKKIFILFIVSFVLISLFSINVFAEDEIDYNKSFAVEVDGEYKYYSFSFAQSSITWEDYINTSLDLYGECDFAILGDYVIYNNSILQDYNKNLYIDKTDNVLAAAGRGIYHPTDEKLVTVDGYQIKFHDVFEYFNINIVKLSTYSNVIPGFSFYGNYNQYILYNGKLICFVDNDGDLCSVLSDEDACLIQSKYNYYLVEIGECYHQYRPLWFKVFPTCVTNGIRYYECSICKEITEINTGIDLENGHSYVYGLYKEPTCVSIGISKGKCEYCNRDFIAYYEPLGHTYSEPTECLELPTCVRCGSQTREGMLEHDAGDGCDCIRCGLHIIAHDYGDDETNRVCFRCGYKLPDPNVEIDDSTVGDKIKDTVNNGWNAVKNVTIWLWNKGKDGLSWVGNKGKDVATKVVEVFVGDDGVLDSAKEVLRIGFLIMALILMTLLFIKFIGFIKAKFKFAKENKTKRKRRKRKKRGK